MRHATSILLVGATVLSWSAAAMAQSQRLAAHQVPAPLSDGVKAQIRNLPEDDLSGTRRQAAHYYKGNEGNLDVFVPYIAGVGGAYVGIGPDQNFTLAAKARSELVFVMDYDIVVVRLLRVEVALVKGAATPDDFIGLWDDPEDLTQVTSLLQREYGTGDESTLCAAEYKQYRKALLKHFRSCRKAALAGKKIHWLGSDDDYAFVRALAVGGRIVPIEGDLLKGKATTGVANLLSNLEVQVKVAYISNAEEYWSRYTDEFEQSFIALNLDAGCLVLRTFHDTKLPKHPPDEYYHYNVQSGDDLLSWLKKEGRTRYREMMQGAKKVGSGYVSTLGNPLQSQLPVP